jgi:hypothetical protein
VLHAQVESARVDRKAFTPAPVATTCISWSTKTYGRVLDDQAMGLAVELGAPVAVGDLTGLNQELIDLGVVVRPVGKRVA